MGAQPTDAAHADHRQALAKAAQANGWRLIQDATMQLLDGSCLYDLAWTGRHYENYIFGNDWEYVEVGFMAHGQTGLYRLRKRMVHYGVMSITLPRKLPNVVFDSLKHQKRQFRLIFDPKQHISLEGNFDKYFATYFGTDYTIDDLSFITPEVMEALIAADAYDIEIVHDKLLLFGPVADDPAAQLKDMTTDLHFIRKKLLNNILTYRDERVPYSEGRRVVARAGMFLGRRMLNPAMISFLLGFIPLLLLTILVMVAILSAIS